MAVKQNKVEQNIVSTYCPTLLRVPGLLLEVTEIYPDMRDINQFTVVQV